MPSSKIKVLFLCTGNSCRSIMAEALLTHLGHEAFEANSAGSRPAGFVHPLALHALSILRIPLDDLTSKSWDAFAGQEMDVVITLCDSAAQESCPVFPGTKFKAHWSIPDPAFYEGNEMQRAAFAVSVAKRIQAKVEGLVSSDWSQPREVIERRLCFLGEI